MVAPRIGFPATSYPFLVTSLLLSVASWKCEAYVMVNEAAKLIHNLDACQNGSQITGTLCWDLHQNGFPLFGLLQIPVPPSLRYAAKDPFHLFPFSIIPRFD